MHSHRRKSIFLRYLSLTVALILLARGGAFSQVITATVMGTVRDASGAVVQGADVTATNIATGLVRTVQSGQDGSYTIPLLPIGEYSIRAVGKGFKGEEHSRVTLPIDGRVRVDFLLQVGAVADNIVVEGSPPLLDQDTAELGETIENVRVNQLPLNGRQFVQLTLLTPGVVPEVKGTLSSPLALSGLSVNANGTRFEDNVFLLDGVPIRDEIYERLTVSPSIDAIQEFKVHTSNYSAEFGGHGGAQINVSTKAGTNAVHGTVYEFLRNEVLDAKNFFDITRGPFRQNQFGFSVGGPIRQNKTFFFGNYEGSRIFKGITLTSAVPTAALRSGDFRGMGPIVDPLTGAQFSSGGVLDVIPASRIAPFAQAFLDKIPLPTSSGLGRNFAGFGDRDVQMDQFTVRMDHSFTNSDTLFGRFTYSDVNDLEPISAAVNLSAGSPQSPPGFGQTTFQNSRNVGVQYTHVFNPNFLNAFRFGYNFLDTGQTPENSTTDFSQQFGFQGTNPAPLGAGFSNVIIPGFSTFGDTSTRLFVGNNTFSFIDDVVFNRKNHSFKFGGSYTRTLPRTEFVFNTAGQFRFLGVFSNNPFADFLLGYPAVANALTGDPLLHGRGYRFGAYVQDDWRVTPKLTFNLGLRYDVNSPFSERDNKMANFAPEIGGFVTAGGPGTNPAADPSRFPGVPFSTAKQLGYPNALTDGDYNNFAPRLGFAYSPFSSFVVRGGYGIFYNTGLLGGRFGIMGFNPPFTGLKLFLNFDPTNPVAAQDALVTPSLNIVLGQGPQKHFPNAYLQQWNLSLEKQLSSSVVIEAAYMGSRGTKLDGTVFPNQPNAGTGDLDSRLRWPVLGPDLEIAAPAFSSWYHSLILRGEKRYSHGLVFSGSYTFAKSIDTGGGSLSNFSDQTNGAPQYTGNIAAERGLSSFDVRHRFVLNGIYELPLGRGKAFLGSADGIAQKLVGGWQLNSIIVLQSGRPATPVLPFDRSNTGANTDRPNRIGDPNTGPKTPDEWFNTDAFALQPAGQFGNAGRGIINGPGYDAVDLSAVKMTPITERLNLEFRAEAFNLFNHTNFDLPNRQFGSPTFGQIFSANDPRELQFAVKLHF